MTLIRDKSTLHIYIEGRKRKTFVGELKYGVGTESFEFCYDIKYLKSNSAIALGPDIPLKKIKHTSKGKLFPTFWDRIPSRKNAAYKDYCRQTGIEVDEKNPIVLLGTIGKRGPSSFIFEAVWHDSFDIQKTLRTFRHQTGLSLQDVALAFNLNYVTLQKIETGKSKEPNVTRLIRIFLEYPMCLEEQLKRTKCRLHHRAMDALVDYMEHKEGGR